MGGDPADHAKGAPEAADHAHRRRQVVRTCLLLGMLVAGVLLAWLAGEAVRLYLQATWQRPGPASLNPRPVTQPARGPRDLADLIVSPLAEAGLVPVDEDPAGLRPPPRARRTYAFRRRLTDQVEQQGRYDVPGDGDAVVAHYDKLLAERGFQKIKDSTDPTGRRMAVYHRQPTFATVALRTNPRDAKMVIVVTTVVSPAKPPPTR